MQKSDDFRLEKCKSKPIFGWKNAIFNYRNNEKFLVINSLSPTIPTFFSNHKTVRDIISNEASNLKRFNS